MHMRISLRNQIIEMLDTVIEGVCYVADKGLPEAEIVFADCLEALHGLMSTMKDNLSPKRYAVYNELLLGVIDNLGKISELGYASAQDAETGILAIIDELINEPEVKAEVVFFPYKASMWDSLESVWMAAVADPRCHAVVVPIPYYDRKPDGSAGKKYYEGDLFPRDVPITHYEDYDLAAVCPDIAYIHNPYDGNNYVTSVDPRYYSYELKKHVGKLVYVPYYVSRGGNNINYNMSVLNGGIDIVVAFNNTDYHTYRLLRQDKDIAVLGSPKIDRVLRTDSVKPEMPEAWKPALEGKKVFLLLTTVDTILQYDKFGEKLRRIISIFENRDDIAVIWRPHPLSVATINAMRPQLLQAYRALEQSVASGKFGVLDHTPDVELAMALSDAFIGAAASSVFYMYCVTGKPAYTVSFESIDDYTEDDYEEALCADYTTYPDFDGDTLWGACYSINGLCKIDTNDGSMTYLGTIPVAFQEQKCLFSQTIKLDNKLLLVPLCTEAFVFYDIGTGEFTKIIIPDQAEADMVFLRGWAYKDCIYFIPVHSRAIARYNKLTGEFSYFYGWFEAFSRFITADEQSFFSDACLVRNCLYMSSLQNNIVTELNLDTMDINIHHVGNGHNRYMSIAHNGSCFWLTRLVSSADVDGTDSIVRWNPRTGAVLELKNFPDGFRIDNNVFQRTHLGGLREFGKHILALPVSDNMIVKISPKSCHLTAFDTGFDIDFSKREKPFYDIGSSFVYFYALNDHECIMITRYNYSLLKINTRTGKSEMLKLRFKNDSHKAQAEALSRFVFRHIYNEHILFTADQFVEACVNGRIPARNEAQAAYYKALLENTDGTCGKKVHDYVMRSIDAAAQNLDV